MVFGRLICDAGLAMPGTIINEKPRNYPGRAFWYLRHGVIAGEDGKRLAVACATMAAAWWLWQAYHQGAGWR